ncbi:MAG: murein transglycosylase A [Betaproteobacteria bacterium]|nr:murein transglycosylase A [Betaproteobacteria bacterium]
MRHYSSILFFKFLVSVIFFLTACTTSKTPVPTEIPAVPSEQPGRELRQVTFADIPGWNADKVSEAWPAFVHSCKVLKKQAEWRNTCLLAEKVRGEESEIRTFLETFLEPYQVVLTDGNDTGMITGYYEPLLQGSRIQTARYQTPLYRVPPDLIVVDLAVTYPQLKGLRLRGKLNGKRLVPYLTRSEIRESRHLAGSEIVWVDDPVDAFFLQVQGSGRVFIEKTGETIRVAYGDQNGHPYRSIGRYLVDKGEMKLEEASAQRIKKWLSEHPARLNEVLDANPSYVFFREEKLDNPQIGPKGALGVPLTGGRSVAVDSRHIPLGVPLFINTTEPNSDVLLQRLVMAQDTGGAIKGVLRLDYFWGFGNEAGERAGKMKQPVKMWILQPKKDK